MKKFTVGILILALSLISGTLAGATATTDNFSISSYDVQMVLGRDDENRSTLKTIETITAQFPEYDQNHGLERAFVKEYDGHSTAFDLVSVANSNGDALPYSWNGNALRIGDSGTYVHGAQTYVITYSQRDVTKYYEDTARDEFYWDAIGVEWRVPIDNVAIRITVDGSLRSSLSGDSACYQGAYGSTSTCDLSQSDGEYSTKATNLQPGQGITTAIGFLKGTLAPYKQSFIEVLIQIWFVVQLVLGALSVVALIWLSVRFISRKDRKSEMGTIVPEYLPPKDVSVTASARTCGYATSVMAAQMLDFAVRRYVKIYEVKEKTLFAGAEYEIEIIRDINTLRAEEREILKDTFGELPSIGQRMNLKELQNNPGYYKRTLNNDTDLDVLIRGEYGLREADNATKAWMRRFALVALVVAACFLSPIWLIVALIAFILSFLCWRLTDKGLALKRYLKGLKLYIGVAEVERIKMLQSPDGAQKVASVASGTDSAQLIKLYERVLPYAVLFGQEKEWNKRLGSYYATANTTPDWYSGYGGVFHAAAFSSAMSNFSQANSYASSSSSSSGGSSGGGSSGGGGGGGGGGGW